MLDLLKFRNNERKYILAVLFSFWWCSAQDIVGVSNFSEASINRQIRKLESEKIAFRISTGRISRRQARWGLTAYGVGYAEDELGCRRNLQHSKERWLAWLHQLDTLEAIHPLLPKMLADQVPYHSQCGSIQTPVDDGCDLTLRYHVPTGYERDGVVVFSHQAALSGFALVEHDTVIALAEYEVPETALAGTNLEGYADAGLVRRVILPIVKYGPHLVGKKPNLLADLYSGLETAPEVVWLGDRIIEYPASPAGAVIVVDNIFDAVAAEGNFAAGLPALVIGVDGTRFKSMEPDYQYGKIHVPHRSVDIGKPEEVTSMMEKHPAFPEQNPQLSWRVFETITREGLVTEPELIARLGPKNARSVRTALRSWSDGKMVARINDSYDLSETGADYWGLVYGDPVGATELMARRTSFNAERFGSKTRQDAVKAIANRLNSEGFSVRHGWELGPPLDEIGGWSLNATPDLWVVSKRIDGAVLYALHYVDEAANLAVELRDGGYYRTAHARLRNEPYRQWFPLLVVGESEPILDEIRAAGLDLLMATTTVAALLDRGTHLGGRAIWRYGSEVAEIDQLPWTLPMQEALSASDPEPPPRWGEPLIGKLKERLASDLSQSGLTAEFGMQELLTEMGTSQIGIVLRVRTHPDKVLMGPEVELRVRFVSSFGLGEMEAAAKGSDRDGDSFGATLVVCANLELRQSMPRWLDGRLVATATLGECALGPHVGPDSVWRHGDRSIGIDRLIRRLGEVRSRPTDVSRLSEKPASVNDETPISREELRDWLIERMIRNSLDI